MAIPSSALLTGPALGGIALLLAAGLASTHAQDRFASERQGMVLASDAFFPFADGLLVAIEADPPVAQRTLQAPSARPAGIANSPAAEPYAFDETVFDSTACPFASTRVRVTGVWGMTRHRARSPRPLKTTAFQSTF